MKIKAGEWTIEAKAPSGDWVVTRDTADKDGNVIEGGGANSYHGKLHQAVLSILNHRLGERTATDLKDVIRVIREETKEIKKMCAEVEEGFRKGLAKRG